MTRSELPPIVWVDGVPMRLGERLPEDVEERLIERAAIMEHHGGVPRDRAEELAARGA